MAFAFGNQGASGREAPTKRTKEGVTFNLLIKWHLKGLLKKSVNNYVTKP